MFNKKQKHGHITSDQIASAGLFSDISKEPVDLSIILGQTEGINYHLILARWHSQSKFINFTTAQSMHLYSEVRKLLPSRGFEAHRVGGSSGTTQVNKAFFQFLGTPGNFPRKGKGVKLVRSKTRWDAFYVNTTDKNRCAILYKGYTQPQPGGSFFLPHEMLATFPILRQFMTLKIYTAMILEKLNNGFKSKTIQPGAVANQLKDLIEARGMGKSCDEIIALVSAKNKYTMVCYPVGFHIDHFNKGEESLENKVCFVHPRFKETCGRGGAGPGVFVWALLDWKYDRPGLRRQQFLALGGNPNKRVTQPAMEEFLTQHATQEEAVDDFILRDKRIE